MRKYFLISDAGLCIFFGSCASPPKLVVRTIVDVDMEAQTPDFGNVVIVSDVGKQYGKTFGESFVQNFKSLSQNSGRNVSIITYIEFIRSPYNEPTKKSSFPDTLFVFINGHSIKSDGYGVTNVKYQMNVQFLDQDPFISQEIEVGVSGAIWSSKSERSAEFAKTVFSELHTRNIL